MPGTALVSMGLTWAVVTSDNVSYRALNRLVILAIAIGILLLARRRWSWVIASLLSAGWLYVGIGLGGLTGIAIIVISIGIGSFALIVALDEIRRISPETPINLCTEERQVWEMLADRLEMSPDALFCCCGQFSAPRSLN